MFKAHISASSHDADHPRKSVVRAIHYRGGKPVSTATGSVCRHRGDVPVRSGWGNAIPVLPYPDINEK